MELVGPTKYETLEKKARERINRVAETKAGAVEHNGCMGHSQGTPASPGRRQ